MSIISLALSLGTILNGINNYSTDGIGAKSNAPHTSDNTGAKSAADAVKLKEFYRQAQKHGAGGIKELQDGRFRFYGETKPANTPGEMAGARPGKEWNPNNGKARFWVETIDGNGKIRQVRPDTKVTGGKKIHYMFDADGNYIGQC